MDFKGIAQDKPKFNDVWNDIQSKMGAKPKEPRKAKKSLDKDDFMRIMITQMKNQDPTKPFEADKLASDMAKIASVEQLGRVNQALDKLADQNRPLERLAMTNLIGKEVTVDRSRFPHEKGQKSTLSFTLPADSTDTKLVVLSQTGDVVLTKDLGEKSKGPSSFVWNGKNDGNMNAESGIYSMFIHAKDELGRDLQIDTRRSARVMGVSYKGEQPVFMIGDANSNEFVAMNNIIQIKDGTVSMNPGGMIAKPSSSNLQAEVEKKSEATVPNHVKEEIIKFEKIKHLKKMGLDEEQIEKIMNPLVESSGNEPSLESKKAGSKEKGFPNGLGAFNQEPRQNAKGATQDES